MWGVLLLCLGAAAHTSSAGGPLPPGWHRRQLASGQTYYLADDEPGVVKWSLPEPKAGPAAATVADREVPDSGHRRRVLATGERAVATLSEGGRQLVRGARTHDEGYAGGVSYTVTTTSGHHRRLPEHAVQEAAVQFESPTDGAVLVAPAEHPAVNLSAALSSEHLRYARGEYQLCIELLGAPLLRQPDGTPRVDAASYEAADAFESMSVACFDELQPLELLDLPPARFRLLATIHGEGEPHLPNATVDITVLGRADTYVVASYDWQRMEPWQSAGQGLEVNQSSSMVRFVRIPPRWALDLPLAPSAFGTLSLEVESSTTVDFIRAKALKWAEEIASGSPKRRCAPGHVHRIVLSLDGTTLLHGGETVSSLDLWRRRASLRVQVSNCEESPELQQIKDFVKRRSLDAMDVHEHPAHSLPPLPDPGFPLSAEDHAKLRLQASLARWAARERDKKFKN